MSIPPWALAVSAPIGSVRAWGASARGTGASASSRPSHISGRVSWSGSSRSVATSADLTLTKVASVGSGSATAGSTISYTVTLVNLGPSTALNVTITDILSAGLTLVSSSSNNSTATGAAVGGTVGATTTSLALGQTLLELHWIVNQHVLSGKGLRSDQA